jgi:hypothetical protein
VPEEDLIRAIADVLRLFGSMELAPHHSEPFALCQFPLLTAPVLTLLSLSMDSVWRTTRVESIFIKTAQRLSANLALVVKKRVLEPIETGGSGVSHDLKAGQQLDVTRRAPFAHHADALRPIAGSILWPILCHFILRGSLIGHARLLTTADHKRFACSGFATLTDVKLRRLGCSRYNFDR